MLTMFYFDIKNNITICIIGHFFRYYKNESRFCVTLFSKVNIPALDILTGYRLRDPGRWSVRGPYSRNAYTIVMTVIRLIQHTTNECTSR